MNIKSDTAVKIRASKSLLDDFINNILAIKTQKRSPFYWSIFYTFLYVLMNL